MKDTTIIINNGIEAILVNNPNSINMPQIISNAPTNVAQNSGFEKPIFAKRPAPTVSGVINFCNPSDRKTKPTTIRGMIVGTDALLKILFFIFLALTEEVV